jgi:hypothetical protein
MAENLPFPPCMGAPPLNHRVLRSLFQQLTYDDPLWALFRINEYIRPGSALRPAIVKKSLSAMKNEEMIHMPIVKKLLLLAYRYDEFSNAEKAELRKIYVKKKIFQASQKPCLSKEVFDRHQQFRKKYARLIRVQAACEVRGRAHKRCSRVEISRLPSDRLHHPANQDEVLSPIGDSEL